MNQILNKYDLKIILERLGLDVKDKGNYFSCLCPFHNEKVPSFGISKNGLYNCFSCGEKGNIFKLIYKLTGKTLYNFLGIDKNNFDENFYFKNIKEKATRIIIEKQKELDVKGNLLSIYDNKEVLNYLRFRRCDDNFIDNFKIQYCIYCKINGTEFRNRIMIPIYVNSRLTGYEGRDYTGKQTPKVLYNKGAKVSSLFNIDNLDRNKELIICEGTFDIPLIFSNITQNITHTFGVKITNNQKKLINEFKKVTLFIDNDKPGRNGLSEFDKFYENEYHVAMGKEEKDPGDMSLEEIKDTLDNKILAIDYFLDKSNLFKKEEIKW